MNFSLLDSILAPGGLQPVFQPIVEVGPEGARLHAFEALIRGPRGTNMEDADVLFEYVRRKREESAVDRACVAVALTEAAGLPDAPRISLNVHASTLGRDQDFVAHVEAQARRNRIEPSRVIVEIVEHSPCWDGPSFQEALAALRGLGAAIALDDIGHGMSNYQMVLDSRPDYFKMDSYFVNGVAGDAYRRAILESVTLLAQKFGGRVIAEGVDDAADLKTLGDLGIDLVQGWLFSKARPAAEYGGGRVAVERLLQRTAESKG